ncbi:ATP-dependent RecD-like DNA helicase [Candidatus Aminicenantes bacterium AC-335-K20]|jgi:exodeoxyribonuclease V alpha subunit|nr:ATP-dependent RecD-like DNA helicase [SCandidatus Aminicenantes bacterium Aminicenantia_JdfR_composite]MCP2619191.1 ATP-dependent RecD-like DNA helicase [Candidatus Aminicenantes bacterium AC-335-K20]MCP2620945.1 ATP-dependent RecD-like DNA helicase [Candidatus Aminicenantes bacterium AC-334-E05]
MIEMKGEVERIIFFDLESGYTVAEFLTEENELITIVGNFHPLSVGETLKVAGEWEINPRFGTQFKVKNFIPILPSSVRGIERYLSSGLVKGIGPVLARRIVKKFGEETIKIIDEKPEKLLEVSGIGAQKMEEIIDSWKRNKEVRELIIFLQQYGVSTNLALKIYNRYRSNCFKILKTNPYQLSYDVWGIGFKTADQIAMKLGISPDSIERLKAFIIYILNQDIAQGNVFSSIEEIKKKCEKELGVNTERIEEAIEELNKNGKIIIEEYRLENGENNKAIFLPYLYQAERKVTQVILDLASSPVLLPPFDIQKAILEIEEEMGIRLTGEQKMAIEKSLQYRILIITGGPGTGKTTIIKAIVELYKKLGRKCLLSAPTGRASKRLSEATHHEAKTIHRLLEYNPQQNYFRRNEANPLDGDILIIDEFSMVDLPLMYHLVKALPKWIHLILVGDKDQLPSVGPGNLLKDIIDSGKVETVELNEIFRQAKQSLIVVNAHRVNKGKYIIIPKYRNSDFCFIEEENERNVFEYILKFYTKEIPYRLNIHPLSTKIQVISPMYKGLVGVDNLNQELQRILNPGGDSIQVGTRKYKVNDKVMQIKNNYEKEVFNGDVGKIVELDKENLSLLIEFDERRILYQKEELDEITLAYAISVHKSQGSEYDAVIIPILFQHYIMLQRNLFYTALTRARKFVAVIGSKRAIYIAIKNDTPLKRNSLLKERLIST